MKLNKTAIMAFKELLGLAEEIAVSDLAEVEITTLKAKEVVAVDRLTLSYCDGASFNLIAKHLVWDRILDDASNSPPLSLRYEAAAYEFLTSIRETFDRFPRVYRLLSAILVLEDLGASPISFSDETSAQFAAMEMLARMHAASNGRRQVYESILKKRRLPIDPEQQRSHRLPASFNRGMQLLRSFASERRIPGSAWEQPARYGLQLLADRDQELDCLIHDDLVSLRQCAMRDGKLHLFDFGHARFGHPFVDILRMFIGKVEYNAASQSWFRKAYDPVGGVFRHYRLNFEKYYKKLEDVVWKEQFTAIAIAMGVALLGVLVHVIQWAARSNIKPAKPLAEVISDSLSTTMQFARRHHGFESFALFCEDALEHILVLSNLFSKQVERDSVAAIYS